MKRFLSFIDKVNAWVGRVSSLFVIVLTFLFVYEVVLRYVFRKPTIWSHELTSMIFGAYIILGGAYTLYNKAHVNMDLIYIKLSSRARAFLDIITFWMFALFCITLLWKSGETAWRAIMTSQHSSSIWSPPVYPIKLVLPIGTLMLLLQGIAKFIRDILIVCKKDGQ